MHTQAHTNTFAGNLASKGMWLWENLIQTSSTVLEHQHSALQKANALHLHIGSTQTETIKGTSPLRKNVGAWYGRVVCATRASEDTCWCAWSVLLPGAYYCKLTTVIPRHCLNQCYIYKIVKVVHEYWSGALPSNLHLNCQNRQKTFYLCFLCTYAITWC